MLKLKMFFASFLSAAASLSIQMLLSLLLLLPGTSSAQTASTCFGVSSASSAEPQRVEADKKETGPQLPTRTSPLSQASGESFSEKSPMRGSPTFGSRIAVGVRGEEGDNSKIFALAPDRVGVTSHSQPVLYWYISKPTTGPIRFTLNDELRGKTLVRADLPSPKEAGIQAIKVSDYNCELSPGVVYRWFVTVAADPSRPSKDIFSGGSIMYREPTPDLRAKLASKRSSAAVHAEEGLWYDALADTWKSGKTQDARILEGQRLCLLKQVGFGASTPGKPKSVLDDELELLHFMGK